MPVIMKRPHSHNRPYAKPTVTPDGVVVSCPSGMEIGKAALDRLEELDDTIFAALDGDAEALDRSRTLWTSISREVDAPLVAESGAQYVRQARTVWDASRSDPEQSLARAFAALEVLGLVGDDR